MWAGRVHSGVVMGSFLGCFFVDEVLGVAKNPLRGPPWVWSSLVAYHPEKCLPYVSLLSVSSWRV